MTEKNAQTECLHCSHIDGRIKHAKTCPKREPSAEPGGHADVQALIAEHERVGPCRCYGCKLAPTITTLRATIERLEQERDAAVKLSEAAVAMVDEHQDFVAKGWPQSGYTPAFSGLRVAVAEYRLRRRAEKGGA